MSIDLRALYTHLHAHPELSFEEHETAALMATHLSDLGFEVHTGIAGTGVVGVLHNGDGPTVWMRADMDALPVREQTGLPYASTVQTTDPHGNTVSVMHACGHDVHMTAAIGAAEQLVSKRQDWSGTLVVVMQPAEEIGLGARAMLDAGLLDFVPKPSVVIAQHQSPIAAGLINMRPGPQTSGCDTIRITMYGRGGHGSRPHTTVDAVLMAAATVVRLQSVVARHIDPRELAVVTVGSMHAGTKDNIIADEAVLEVSIRYANDVTRERLLANIERIVRAEALASGSDIDPLIEIRETLPPTINDEVATLRVQDAFRRAFGEANVVDFGMSPGSEDVSWFARDAEVPMVLWYLGSWNAREYYDAVERGTVDQDIPTNHSPFLAPVPEPTLQHGVTALTEAALEFLSVNL